MSCNYIRILTEDIITSMATSSQIGDMHSRKHYLMGKEIDIHFLNRGTIYYKLNHHVQKIRQALYATYGTTGQLFRLYSALSAVYIVNSPTGD